MSGWTPNSSSVSVVVGPMDAITIRRRPCEYGLFQTCFGGDTEQVRQLDGSGKHGDIGLTFGDAADGFAQWRGIFGEIPLIDADGGDFSAAGTQGRQQFGIRFPVFLNGDVAFGSRCRGRQKLTPGVWLGNGDGNRNLHFAQYGQWFGAARDHGYFAKSFGESLRGVARGQHFIECAGAHTGEQDHHVEFAAKEALGEGEGAGIVFQGRFAHGGGDEWLAILAANEFGDFRGAAALEGEDAEAVEGH